MAASPPHVGTAVPIAAEQAVAPELSWTAKAAALAKTGWKATTEVASEMASDVKSGRAASDFAEGAWHNVKGLGIGAANLGLRAAAVVATDSAAASLRSMADANKAERAADDAKFKESMKGHHWASAGSIAVDVGSSMLAGGAAVKIAQGVGYVSKTSFVVSAAEAVATTRPVAAAVNGAKAVAGATTSAASTAAKTVAGAAASTVEKVAATRLGEAAVHGAKTVASATATAAKTVATATAEHAPIVAKAATKTTGAAKTAATKTAEHFVAKAGAYKDDAAKTFGGGILQGLAKAGQTQDSVAGIAAYALVDGAAGALFAPAKKVTGDVSVKVVDSGVGAARKLVLNAVENGLEKRAARTGGGALATSIGRELDRHSAALLAAKTLEAEGKSSAHIVQKAALSKFTPEMAAARAAAEARFAALQADKEAALKLGVDISTPKLTNNPELFFKKIAINHELGVSQRKAFVAMNSAEREISRMTPEAAKAALAERAHELGPIQIAREKAHDVVAALSETSPTAKAALEIARTAPGSAVDFSIKKGVGVGYSVPKAGVAEHVREILHIDAAEAVKQAVAGAAGAGTALAAKASVQTPAAPAPAVSAPPLAPWALPAASATTPAASATAPADSAQAPRSVLFRAEPDPSPAATLAGRLSTMRAESPILDSGPLAFGQNAQVLPSINFSSLAARRAEIPAPAQAPAAAASAP